MKVLSKERLYLGLIILVVTILGFMTKFYDGPFDSWVNNSLGGLFYVAFWILVFSFLFYGKNHVLLISFIVFIITSLLEFTQLYHHPILASVRKTFIGRTLIGTSFVPSDFIYYFIGAVLGWGFLKWLYSRWE